ncbi:ARM repeat-containing protein [Russula earlei]|uniref:ARM repeat-containing protein n=1 Tax=Russula earlei TaxID=71964 RepID=A0ACC0U9I3_9AGAM|nr:ARM repeat-containing protein [Russula earlei]
MVVTLLSGPANILSDLDETSRDAVEISLHHHYCARSVHSPPWENPRKSDLCGRHNPVRVPDSHLPKGLDAASSTSNKTEAVLPIITKIGSADPVERKWACVAVSNLIYNDPCTRRLLQGKNVVGTLIGRLTDSEEEVVVEAAGALRNLCIDGGYEICAEMYNKNILAPLATFIPKISSILAQYVDSPIAAPENARKVVYEFAENVITILWCLSETSNKALNAVSDLALVPFLMSFLSSRDRLPLSTVTSAAQCLYVLTEDNPPVVNEARANFSNVTCLLEIAKTHRDVQDVKGKNAAGEERAVALAILACGILRNLAPFLPPSSIASVDLDKEIILPVLAPVVSSASLQEATAAVRELTENSDANQWATKHQTIPDHKSETEVGLERVETKLKTVQLALEILTGVCATLPDPDYGSEATASPDDSATYDVSDCAMAVDGAADQPVNSHASNVARPSFLPTLLEPLLALIQPTELSFLTPSPHAPTTSALGAIHVAAFECLSNAFLALAAAPGSAGSDVYAGQRVWNTVWAALVGAGNPMESAPGSARAAVWDIAVGVLWGVGAVWTGKIVPEEAQVQALISLCNSREDDAIRVKCIGALSVIAQHVDPASLDANRIIASYLLGLLVPGRTGTETMLQAAESLIDIFADERAPAEANFRAGNVLAALEGAVDDVRRAVKSIDRKKEGGRELKRHGEEVRDNLVAFVRYRRSLGL